MPMSQTDKPFVRVSTLRGSAHITVGLVTLMLAAAACGPPPGAIIITQVPVPVSQPQSEPPASELRIDQVIVPAKPVLPVQRTGPGITNRITLTATNADVRELLPVLASAAGVSLVMGSDVRGRVSVSLRDVAAVDALRAVIEEAGLTVGINGIPVPFSPVVFYQLPVNINTASAATIKARFDVSTETAEWIVRARLK